MPRVPLEPYQFFAHYFFLIAKPPNRSRHHHHHYFLLKISSMWAHLLTQYFCKQGKIARLERDKFSNVFLGQRLSLPVPLSTVVRGDLVKIQTAHAATLSDKIFFM